MNETVSISECTIKRKNDYELCDVCTLINGETMTSENDFKGNASGTVTIIAYYGVDTLNFIPAGLFKLYHMVNDVVIRNGNFKEITSNTFKNAKFLWFLTIMDTKTFDTIAYDAFNDCNRLEYLTLSNHSLKTLDLQFNFPILKQLEISWNPVEAINRIWYQSLPNCSIFFNFNTCFNTTGLHQALIYKIPGEPRVVPCFANFEKITLITSTETSTTTTTPQPLTIVECKFQNHRIFGYTCVLSKVMTDDFLISGKHLSGKTNGDVTGVIFLRSQLTKVPSNIFGEFLNLLYIDVSNSGIVKADSSTVEVCGKLKYLDLSDNDIVTVDDGFLDSCNSLEQVYIENNLINSVSPCSNFMKSQKNLVEVSLIYNICIDNDGYFSGQSLSENYKQNFIKSLMTCFTNFLDPPVSQVLYRRNPKRGEISGA